MEASFWSKAAYRTACFLVGAVLFLITLGGQVTTRVAGMAVPDWPGTFGHNMFLYPWSGMTRSLHIFLEHSHRLVASGVGFITLLVTGLVFATQPGDWPENLLSQPLSLLSFRGFSVGKESFKGLGFWGYSTDV